MNLIKSLIDFFAGTKVVRTENEGALYDFLIKQRITYDTLSDGVFRLRSRDAERHKDALASIGCKTDAQRGFPAYFKRYRKRAGLWLGALIFASLTVLSQRIVWNIEVTGCRRPDVVKRNLEELGFTLGTDFKRMDLDRLHNDYLRTYDDLSWISVNMEGTYAHVEASDLDMPGEEYDAGPVNVVASEGGRITGIEVREGRAAVSIGDFVAEGDLLIGGVISVRDEKMLLKSADGDISAEVVRTFDVRVPKIRTDKEYTGEEFTEKSILFFKNKIKISGNSRISCPTYDKIYNNETVYIFDSLPLPLSVETVTYKAYAETSRHVTEDEARDIFEKLYPQRVDEALDGASLTSVSYSDTETESEYIRTYEIKCTAVISKEKTINAG